MGEDSSVIISAKLHREPETHRGAAFEHLCAPSAPILVKVDIIKSERRSLSTLNLSKKIKPNKLDNKKKKKRTPNPLTNPALVDI